MNRIAIIISMILTILLVIVFRVVMHNSEIVLNENASNDNVQVYTIDRNEEISTIETSVDEERTTPNTLIIYKTYYTKCKHYLQKYEDIDATLVNLNEKEFKEKKGEWSIDEFSPEEIELSKEVETFCDEHYKLKLKDNVIVIYKIDEVGNETEYLQTEITTEYLTNEDILKLTTGIEVYGKEKLTSTIEDYE